MHEVPGENENEKSDLLFYQNGLKKKWQLKKSKIDIVLANRC